MINFVRLLELLWKLNNISSGNYFIFLSDGTHPVSSGSYLNFYHDVSETRLTQAGLVSFVSSNF
jgi:hypothetical protein